jgi:hypothetical protein
MESDLLVEGIGAWKSFDDIEEHLILDELLLLHESLKKKNHNYFRIMGSFQGIEIDPFEDDQSNDDLPEEIKAFEAEFRKRKAAADKPPDLVAGLGYKKV